MPNSLGKCVVRAFQMPTIIVCGSMQMRFEQLAHIVGLLHVQVGQ